MYRKRLYRKKVCFQAELSMERSARLLKDRCVTPTITKSVTPTIMKSVTPTITKSIPSKMKRIKGLDTRRSILRHRNRTAAQYK